MVDFIGGSIQFIVKYLPQIILMILILVLIMVYMVVHNVHFIKRRVHLERVVEIEGLTGGRGAMHLCKQNMRESDGGQKNCGKLKRNACNLTTCCGWAEYKDGSEKCVAVSINMGQPLGMTHRTNVNDVDALYFKGKKINI